MTTGKGQALTTTHIRPVKSGVGWVVNDTMGPAEIAELDQLLATYGLDTQAADTATGVLSLQQDPNSTQAPTMTGTVNATVEGATIETVAGSGGRIGLGNTSAGTTGTFWPSYTGSPRTRRVRYSALELARGSFVQGYDPGNLAVISSAATRKTEYHNAPSAALTDPSNSFGVSHSIDTPSIGTAPYVLHIAKPHNLATITSIKAWFFVPYQPANLPSVMPVLQLWDINAVPYSAQVGTTTFGTPASTSAWFNNGAPQSVVLNLSGVTYATTTVYSVVLFGAVATVGSVSPPVAETLPDPVWTAIEVNYGNILNEGFPL